MYGSDPLQHETSSYQLPGLPQLPCSNMRGPTPWSNWVIKGQVIAGAYPATMDDTETDRMLTLLLELGMNTFVCLQSEVNLNIPEHLWRSGQGLRPYIRDAQRLLSKAHAANNTRIQQQKLDFLHLAIIDGSITTDLALCRLADDCLARILSGEKLYIHCWGGHGRTGTLVAVLLARLYNLGADEALQYTQAMHDSRRYPQGVRSPQTAVQRAQVKRVINALGLPHAMSSSPSSPLTPSRYTAQGRQAALASPTTVDGLFSAGSAADQGADEGLDAANDALQGRRLSPPELAATLGTIGKAPAAGTRIMVNATGAPYHTSTRPSNVNSITGRVAGFSTKMGMPWGAAKPRTAVRPQYSEAVGKRPQWQ